MDLSWWFNECYATAITPCGYEIIIEIIVLIVVFVIVGLYVWKVKPGKIVELEK